MDFKILCLGMLLLMIIASCEASRFSQLSKTPVKSIKSQDGDVIDCVHISQQPAFDHPLLKNHVIQMRPSYHPNGMTSAKEKYSNFSSNSNKPINQLWQLSGSCNEGTVPIRRTNQREMIRGRVQTHGKLSNSKLQATSADLGLRSQPSFKRATAAVEGDTYYGAKAIMNVWEPKVEQTYEFSLSHVSILGGSSFSEGLNAIQAGWHVYPYMYGDNRTRLFIYWTRDNYGYTGCYNLHCSGFVQTNNEITLGGTLSPLSTFNGYQFQITLFIWKDTAQDAWWLQYNNITIGYWPNSLFTSLADSASAVEWGGQILDSGSDGEATTTQMGSGHFPQEGFASASYMRNLQVVDNSGTLRSLHYARAIAPQPNCYDITLGNNDAWGDFIFYGGPGRNPECP